MQDRGLFPSYRSLSATWFPKGSWPLCWVWLWTICRHRGERTPQRGGVLSALGASRPWELSRGKNGIFLILLILNFEEILSSSSSPISPSPAASSLLNSGGKLGQTLSINSPQLVSGWGCYVVSSPEGLDVEGPEATHCKAGKTWDYQAKHGHAQPPDRSAMKFFKLYLFHLYLTR